MWFLVVAIVVVGSAVAVAAALPGVREEQVRRGLFGEPAREGLIGTWVAAVVGAAEREVRLAYFGGALHPRMWEGTLAEITRPPDLRGATTWRFASGEVWEVDLARLTPRWARRVVVRSVEQVAPELRLCVYVPGGQDLVLSVRDARVASSIS